MNHAIPDSSDLVIMRLDTSRVPRAVRAATRLLHLTPEETTNWYEDRFSSKFFAVGYPKTHNFVDYASSTIKMGQVLLEGAYIGDGVADECHEGKFLNPLGITDFDGMSGSPVFSVRNVIGPAPTPRFCGLAIRGGAVGGQIHFLSANVIRLALDEAVASEKRAGL